MAARMARNSGDTIRNSGIRDSLRNSPQKAWRSWHELRMVSPNLPACRALDRGPGDGGT